jgi:hypothetical protein
LAAACTEATLSPSLPLSRPFLEPERAELPRLRAAVGVAREPAEAFGLLAASGDVPQDWLSHPARRFVQDLGTRSSPPRPTRDPARAPLAPYPSCLEDCALFAADVEGIRAAEAAARAFAVGLEPWGAPSCDTVVWWALPRERYGVVLTDTRPDVNYAPLFALIAFHQLAAEHGAKVIDPFGHAAECADLWDVLAAKGAAFPPGRSLGTGPRAVASLPNYLRSLAALEATGYAALEYFGQRADGQGFVILVAPF